MNASTSSRAGWAGAALIAIAVSLAYANSFSGVLVFDDMGSIRENPTIRHLAGSLFPPTGGLTVSGRPFLNFSFALNQAVTGESLWGYHAVNLVIHVLSALTLFGLVRRTLRLPALASRFNADADWLALVIALIWALHPLQTESVTYVVQRAESLAGLFYLLTFYCFVRGTTVPKPRWFVDASIACCIFCALTKETAVTTPFLVLLYDRIFISASFNEAWERHRNVYYGLALSWLIVFWQVIGTGGRGGTAGFDTPVTAWDYALKQFSAVTLYLRLAFWPQPLILDYGTSVAVTGAQLACGVAVVGVLLAATAFVLRRQPALGFLGAWFFVILAPTSSVVPVATQTMAEHRIYLSLAAVVTLVVLVLHRWLGRRAYLVALLLAAAGGALTVQRNRDYQSWIPLWTQALAYGENLRGELNLGQALAESGHPQEAIDHYAAALKIQPHNPVAQNNWGNALVDLNRPEEARDHFEQALRIRPNYAEAHFNYGNTLMRLGKFEEAVGHYRTTVRLSPEHARAYFNLANALAQLDRLPEAVENYQQAVRLAPDRPDIHFHYGNALMQMKQPAEAIAEYETTLRFDPRNAEAERNLALARQALNR